MRRDRLCAPRGCPRRRTALLTASCHRSELRRTPPDVTHPLPPAALESGLMRCRAGFEVSLGELPPVARLL